MHPVFMYFIFILVVSKTHTLEANPLVEFISGDVCTIEVSDCLTGGWFSKWKDIK